MTTFTKTAANRKMKKKKKSFNMENDDIDFMEIL